MQGDGADVCETAGEDEVEPFEGLGGDVDCEAVGGDAVAKVDAYGCDLGGGGKNREEFGGGEKQGAARIVCGKEGEAVGQGESRWKEGLGRAGSQNAQVNPKERARVVRREY